MQSTMKVKRWLGISVGIVAALLISEHFLLETPIDPGPKFVIDVEALHRAATAGGPLPERIEVEQVAEFEFPGKLVLAGDPFEMHQMVLLAHRVVYADHSIMIDTAMSPEASKGIPGSRPDAAAFARVEAAMKQATQIVVTHEHVDHVGGIVAAPDFASLAPHVQLTTEQLDSPRLERGDFPAGTLEKLKPLAYNGLYAVAPGVVLQKAPGHSPGSQLIYVELANGTRYLFVGDIAWSHDNIARRTGRPGIAKVLMKEDRPAVAAQLSALAELPPNVHVVIAHDPVALASDLAAGLFKRGFSAQ